MRMKKKTKKQPIWGLAACGRCCPSGWSPFVRCAGLLPRDDTESEREPKLEPKTCYSVSTFLANAQLLYLISPPLIDIEEKTRAENRNNPPPSALPTQPLNPHHHHHFHHYMKYDREHNPTMPCKCRRELASRRHKRYACIIWPGEHHLWGDSQRPYGGETEMRRRRRRRVEGVEEERENLRGRGVKGAEQQRGIGRKVKREWGAILGRRGRDGTSGMFRRDTGGETTQRQSEKMES